MKTICQFEHKLCFFIFIIIFTSISDCLSLPFSFFSRYWKYKIVPDDCNVFCFICLCNEDYDRKKNLIHFLLSFFKVSNATFKPYNIVQMTQVDSSCTEKHACVICTILVYVMSIY